MNFGEVTSGYQWSETWGSVADIAASFFALVATAGVYLVFWQARLQRKQIHRDLENIYVQRYWVLLDRYEDSLEGSGERAKAVTAYLALSEDQCDLRACGRVTDETWEIWRPSIYQQLSSDEFGSALGEAPSGRFVQLRTMCSVGELYDPLALTAQQRKNQGL